MTASFPAAVRVGERGNYLQASHSELGDMFAAWSADIVHVEPGVRSSRFAARLAPYRSREEAERALIAAGAEIGLQCSAA